MTHPCIGKDQTGQLSTTTSIEVAQLDISHSMILMKLNFPQQDQKGSISAATALVGLAMQEWGFCDKENAREFSKDALSDSELE